SASESIHRRCARWATTRKHAPSKWKCRTARCSSTAGSTRRSTAASWPRPTRRPSLTTKSPRSMPRSGSDRLDKRQELLGETKRRQSFTLAFLGLLAALPGHAAPVAPAFQRITSPDAVSLRSIAGWLRQSGRDGFVGADVADVMGIPRQLTEDVLEARQRGFR